MKTEKTNHYKYIRKTRMIFMMLMALCLVACSSSKQDDPLVPEPEPTPTPTPAPQQVSINFGGKSGSWTETPVSRSASNTTSTGLETLYQSFKVWGYKATSSSEGNNSTNPTTQNVMDGYIGNYVKKTAESTSSNTADWEYVGISNPNLLSPQTIKYWDYAAEDYRFFAYAAQPNTIAKVTTNDMTASDGTTSKYLSISLPIAYSENANASDVPYVSSLWFSDNHTTPEKYGKCVTLTFAPLIAKLRIKFVYQDGSEGGDDITDIKFRDNRFITAPSTADTPLAGKIKVSYPLSGTPSDTSPQYAWSYQEVAANDKGNIVFTTANKWYYVLPLGLMEDYEQGPYTITAKIKGNEASATVPATYMQWKVGFQYTYIFKLSQAGTDITFSDLEVEQWLPGKNLDNNGSGTAGW